MTGKTIGIIIVVILALAGGWYLLSQGTEKTPVADMPSSIGTTSRVTIAYDAQGFSPASTTVPLGTTVTFTNQTGDRMWVASAVHPTHEAYDGTTGSEHCSAGYSGPVPFDQCAAGANYSYTFLKTGVWKYHNHANALHFGSITVTP